MNLAIYTAIAGEYNQLRDHPYIPGVDWVAFLTHPERATGTNWEVRPLFSYGESDPRRQAKWYKVQSLLEMAEYDRTLWIDGSCEILNPPFFRDLMYVVEDPIALISHPDRNCIYDEAVISLGMDKYRSEPIRDQMQYYIDEYEHPMLGGLWASGLILRNRCPDVERLERAWWHELDRWSCQDQISLPVVLRNLDINPAQIYVNNFWNNTLFNFHTQLGE